MRVRKRRLICLMLVSIASIGLSSEDKITKLREKLSEKEVAGTVVNMLDEVAWLYNLRGSDIDFNPGNRTLERKVEIGQIR